MRRQVRSSDVRAERQYSSCHPAEAPRSITSGRIFQNRFDGIVREQAVWWTVSRGPKSAHVVCRMFTHPLGHELRLELSGRLQVSHVCRTDEEIVECQQRWRATLESEGWTGA